MNSTTQLTKRISDSIENIPNGFRAIDKDRLLEDIRTLYDSVLDLEPSAQDIPKRLVEEPIVKEPKVVVKAKPVVEVIPEPIKVEKIEPPKPIEAELLVNTDAQMEGDPDEGTLAGKLNQKPISDLRSGVPLNEKFGFIQKLFQNNASDYGDAIMKMNKADNQDEALDYFDRITESRKWDAEDVHVKQLRSYIERRHLSKSKANADQ
jgi:hypothetical protein